MPKMNEPETNVEQTMTEEEQRALFGTARKVVLFSIGAWATAIEGIGNLTGRLIERGEIAEQDSRRLVRETMDRPKEKAKQVENGVSRSVHFAKDRVQPATKADINSLNERINRLSEQIGELTPPQRATTSHPRSKTASKVQEAEPVAEAVAD